MSTEAVGMILRRKVKQLREQVAKTLDKAALLQLELKTTRDAMALANIPEVDDEEESQIPLFDGESRENF